MAYIDRAVPLSNGRALNPPLATGRLLKEGRVEEGDRVLLIGAATGYSAALLTALGAKVTAVEAEDGPQLLDGAAKVVRGALAAGAPEGAPYDLLFIDGAVEEVPAALVQQLADGARVVTGLVERGVTRLCSGRVISGAARFFCAGAFCFLTGRGGHDSEAGVSSVLRRHGFAAP
jgi:protein-L-isoaspartate(D-aspartate) O-methyltransferase